MIRRIGIVILVRAWYNKDYPDRGFWVTHGPGVSDDRAEPAALVGTAPTKSEEKNLWRWNSIAAPIADRSLK